MNSGIKFPKPNPIGVFLLLAVVSAVIYANTFYSPFEFDDFPNIVKNHLIRDPANFALLPGPRPVGYLSFALNYRLGGLNPFGYHLVNLLIHAVNGFLVYFLVRLLIQAGTGGEAPSRDRVAIAVSLLFVAHPVQTEAVTYIVQRFASLAALFYLLSLVSFLKGRLAPTGSRLRPAWYAVSVLSAVLAMKTKEIAFTLPFMIVLADLLFVRKPFGKRWIAWIPFLPVLAIIPFSRAESLHIGRGLPSQTPLIGRFDYLMTQFSVVVTYLRLLVLPARQNLDYDYPVYHSFLAFRVWGSFLILSALMAAAVWLAILSLKEDGRSRWFDRRLIGFGILWFFIALSVESTIIPIDDVIYEHRLYLPSVGFFLAAVCAASVGLNRLRVPSGGLSRGVIFTAVLSALCLLTYQRNAVWRNSLTLWNNVVKLSPNKARGHLNLGTAYHDILKRSDRALEEYRTALSLDDSLHVAHYNLGLIYDELGRTEDAVAEYRRAIELNPDYAEAHGGLGLSYIKMGRKTDAVSELKQAVRLDPGNPEFQNNLGNVLSDTGHPEEAVEAYRKALRLRPDSSEINHNLGVSLYGLGRLEEARDAFRSAIALKPDNVDAHYNLGSIYEKMGDRTSAAGEFEAAARLNPNDASARIRLGRVYFHLEKFSESRRAFQAAVDLNPGNPEAHFDLGRALERMGMSEEARSQFNEANRLDPAYKDISEIPDAGTGG
jgi:tetratricopeptide (TPR) repeat protein